MRTLKPGVLYFVLVFAAGFMLGTVRTLWIAPRIGSRAAELMEAPVMLVVSILAAGWVVRRLTVPYSLPHRLVMGVIALVLMLLAEFTLVLWLRGMSIRLYLATRDPVAAMAYYVVLGLFAIMPLLVARK